MEGNTEIKDAINNFLISLEEEQKKEALQDKQQNKEKNEIRKKEDLEEVTDKLRKIISFICPGEKITIEKDLNNSKFSVYGKELSVLIGKNGKTIDAIEYIINLIAKRKKIVERAVYIDIKNYRKQGQEKINKIAMKMAEKAIKENRKIALRPMPSYERKIVHDLLSKVKNIKTVSRDSEPNRRIVIYPSADENS
ncbi:MAG: KH domain-containing protein [Actinobacteria bacterium]|nr:KH domain-containing protein [Actinomycetota bacterium]